MFIADLGQHNMIIGRKWFADKDIWLDPRNRRLIWPEDRTKAEEIQEKLNLVVPREILRRPNPDSDIQRDADRRDKLMEEEDKKLGRKLIRMNSHVDTSNKTEVVDGPPRSISRHRVPRTEKMDRRDRLAKMNRALKTAELTDL